MLHRPPFQLDEGREMVMQFLISKPALLVKVPILDTNEVMSWVNYMDIIGLYKRSPLKKLSFICSLKLLFQMDNLN